LAVAEYCLLLSTAQHENGLLKAKTCTCSWVWYAEI